MSRHLTTFQGSIPDAIREAILAKLPGADVGVEGGGGHFTIDVAATEFQGKSRLECQRLVLSAIKHLMAGDAAPVHAVDTLKTRAK